MIVQLSESEISVVLAALSDWVQRQGYTGNNVNVSVASNLRSRLSIESRFPVTICTVLEGGVLQSVVVRESGLNVQAIAIDYDTGLCGDGSEYLGDVPQTDGTVARGFLTRREAAVETNDDWWEDIIQEIKRLEYIVY